VISFAYPRVVDALSWDCPGWPGWRNESAAERASCGERWGKLSAEMTGRRAARPIATNLMVCRWRRDMSNYVQGDYGGKNIDKRQRWVD